MLAVQSQLTAIKHDVLAAHISAKAKQGACASLSCQMHFLPSSSTGNSTSSFLPNRPLVLGLPAASLTHAGSDDSQEDTGSELKKRKQMLALQNGDTSFVADGDLGTNVIGTDVSHGGDVEMNVISNPLFDENDVKEGPDDQACLGK